jgi:tetratricopeptide (TPR) repeat protein
MRLALLFLLTVGGVAGASVSREDATEAPKGEIVRTVQLLRDGKYKDAAVLFARGAEEHPVEVLELDSQVLAYRKMGGQLDASIRGLEALVTENPEDCGILSTLAQVRSIQAVGKMTEDRDIEAYRSRISKVLEDRRRAAVVCSNASSKISLAEALFSMKQFAEAAVVLEDLASGDPSNPTYLRGLAHNHMFAGNLEASAYAYERLLMIEPSKANDHLGYAEVLAKLGLVEEAARERQLYRDLDTLDVVSLRAKRAEFSEQISHVIMSLNLDSDWKAASNSMKNRNYEEAIAGFRRVREKLSRMIGDPVFGGAAEALRLRVDIFIRNAENEMNRKLESQGQ